LTTLLLLTPQVPKLTGHAIQFSRVKAPERKEELVLVEEEEEDCWPKIRKLSSNIKVPIPLLTQTAMKPLKQVPVVLLLLKKNQVLLSPSLLSSL